MDSLLFLVDDKHVPLFRVLWVADTPHFCGSEDCLCEGKYEVALGPEMSVWANRDERDSLIKAIDEWAGGGGGWS